MNGGDPMKAAVRDRFATALRTRSSVRELDEAGFRRGRSARARARGVAEHPGLVRGHRPAVGQPRRRRGSARRRSNRLGADYAGVVEAVGPGTSRIRAGRRGVRGKDGALAEYVVARADRAITRSARTTSPVEEAAAVPRGRADRAPGAARQGQPRARAEGARSTARRAASARSRCRSRRRSEPR